MNNLRVRLQLAEALGAHNRWFCSQAHCRDVQDDELLVVHYIKNGGASDFARRFDEAMGPQNRWFCSEYYREDVRDPLVLWEYYHTVRCNSRRAG
jgi:hypothetical protein